MDKLAAQGTSFTQFTVASGVCSPSRAAVMTGHYPARYMKEKAEALRAPVDIMIVADAGHNWRKADGVTPIEPSIPEIVTRTVEFLVN